MTSCMGIIKSCNTIACHPCVKITAFFITEGNITLLTSSLLLRGHSLSLLSKAQHTPRHRLFMWSADTWIINASGSVPQWTRSAPILRLKNLGLSTTVSIKAIYKLSLQLWPSHRHLALEPLPFIGCVLIAEQTFESVGCRAGESDGEMAWRLEKWMRRWMGGRGGAACVCVCVGGLQEGLHCLHESSLEKNKNNNVQFFSNFDG